MPRQNSAGDSQRFDSLTVYMCQKCTYVGYKRFYLNRIKKTNLIPIIAVNDKTENNRFTL